MITQENVVCALRKDKRFVKGMDFTMKIGKVIGNIWATRKEKQLEGYKLLLVQPINVIDNSRDSVPIVAVDTIGAGAGEMVIFVSGSSARSAAKNVATPVDAAIIGIVDDMEVDPGAGDDCYCETGDEKWT